MNGIYMPKLKDDLPRLKRIFLFTLIFSLTAHAYMYFSLAPSHDSVHQLLAIDEETQLQVSLGRFMHPVYWFLRGRIPVPWLVGMMSILFLSGSTYLIATLLNIQSRSSLIILCGILSTNMVVTATNATYLFTADTYLLALLLACLGVWFWERLPKWGILASIACFAASMGLYQAYIDVAIGLALILLIRRIMEGEPFPALCRRALRYAVNLAGGALLYYALVKLTQLLTHTDMSVSYNSLNNLLENDLFSMLRLIPSAYFDLAAFFFSPLRSYNTPFVLVCRGLLALVGLALWIRWLWQLRLPKWRVGLVLLCTLLLPIGLNFVFVLSAGTTHELMTFSFFLVYAVCLLPLENYKDYSNTPPEKPLSLCRAAALTLCACMVLHCVIFANGAYFYKRLVFESTSPYAAAIMEQVEKDPNYEPGVTPVAVIGSFSESALAREYDDTFAQYRHLVGMSGRSAITYPETFSNYCRFILGRPINMITDETAVAEIGVQRPARSLPVFPKEGFCAMIDGVMVIKVSQWP